VHYLVSVDRICSQDITGNIW